MIIHDLKLDICPNMKRNEVWVSQYDTDFLIRITLFASKGTFTVESGTTAAIRGTKPDGNGYSANASVSGNVVTVTGAEQMTVVAGRSVYEVTLYRNGKELNTVNFNLRVEHAALDKDTPTSKSQTRELVSIEEHADEIIENVRNMEKFAGDSEAYALGTRGGEAVGTDDPAYQNNSKWYAEQNIPDKTLTLDGRPADAKATGDQLTSIKDDLDNFSLSPDTPVKQKTIVQPTEYVENKVVQVNDGSTVITFTDTTYSAYKKYNVSPGSTYYITGHHFYLIYQLYYVCNSSNRVIASYDGGEQGHDVNSLELTIPDNGAYLYVQGLKENGETGILVEQITMNVSFEKSVNKIAVSPTHKYLFVGDSYAQGYSHDGMNDGWCEYVADYMGLSANDYKVVAQGGYGFSGGGYLSLLDQVTDTDITDVVACGGYNDNASDETTIINAINAFKNKAISKWKNVHVHVGFIASNKAGNGEGAISNWKAIHARLFNVVLPAYQKCASVGCKYLNGVEYALDDSGLTPSDGYHPSAIGNGAIAQFVSNALLTGSAPMAYNSKTTETGLSNEIKEALLSCFRHIGFLDNDANYYNALELALYADSYPKIIAIYEPGTFTPVSGDSIDKLIPYLNVVYYESSESSGVSISSDNYTLSGSLSSEQNEIFVRYSTFITSFMVNVDTSWDYAWSVSGNELPPRMMAHAYNYSSSEQALYVEAPILDFDRLDNAEIEVVCKYPTSIWASFPQINVIINMNDGAQYIPCIDVTGNRAVNNIFIKQDNQPQENWGWYNTGISADKYNKINIKVVNGVGVITVNETVYPSTVGSNENKDIMVTGISSPTDENPSNYKMYLKSIKYRALT